VRPEIEMLPAVPVRIEDTPECSAADIDEISRAFAGGKEDGGCQFEPWRAFQEVLAGNPCDVVVPFAPALGRLFRGNPARAQRLFPQLLAAVAASAVLHQFTRQRDAQGGVIATLDDYAHARRILERAFADVARPDVPDGVQELVEVLRETPGGVDLPTLAAQLGVDRATAQRRAKKAKALGLAVDLAGGQGRRACLIVAPQTREDRCVLPEPPAVVAEMRPDEVVEAAPDRPKRPPMRRTRRKRAAQADAHQPQPRRIEIQAPAPAPPIGLPPTLAAPPPPSLPAARGGDDLGPRVLPAPSAPAHPPPARLLPPIVARAPKPNQLTGGYAQRDEQFKFRAAMEKLIGRRWHGGPAAREIPL
jgi:hypothetical protein